MFCIALKCSYWNIWSSDKNLRTWDRVCVCMCVCVYVCFASPLKFVIEKKKNRICNKNPQRRKLEWQDCFVFHRHIYIAIVTFDIVTRKFEDAKPSLFACFVLHRHKCLLYRENGSCTKTWEEKIRFLLRLNRCWLLRHWKF